MTPDTNSAEDYVVSEIFVSRMLITGVDIKERWPHAEKPEIKLPGQLHVMSVS